MYIVHHYNFGTVREFATLAEAIAFAVRANFEAVVYQAIQTEAGKANKRIALYSSISGIRYL